MKALSSILFIFLSIGSFAQASRTADDIINQPEKKAGIYRISGTYLGTSVVNMNYGSSEILSVMNKKELQKVEIIQIDLVYTNYPKEQDITELNKQRILNMLSIRPDLIKNESISWSIVRQMYCNNESQAKMMFHGAVIYYLPEQSPALSFSETSQYNNLPKNDSVKVTEESLKKFKDDPVVIRAFARNQWKNPTIVADVTCSMYPYMEQTAFWFLLKMNKTEQANIVLFNDGNGRPNSSKRIGHTGGIHSVTSKDYAEFRKLLLKGVSYGCSGDSEENDVEAILEAQKKYPHAKEIILIADNLSRMRDYSLIKDIKVPVRVILCGTKFKINNQYLNLARKTGGSVHTINEDLTNLIDKAEGETFKFMNKSYIIQNGRIIENRREKTRM